MGLGLLALRLPLMGLTAFVCAFAFTGWVPPLRVFAMVVPFGVVAAALLTALYLGLGCWRSGCRTSRRCTGSGRS
jgi:hypothetical protein